jgi:hypothetical protein
MVVPGDTVMLTRRCKERRYRLRPSTETNQVVLYAYAYAAYVTSTEVNAITAMSNHPHSCVGDRKGLHPKFSEIANRIIAQGVGRLQNIPGPVFCRESRLNAVRLTSLEAIVERLAYVIANPVTSFACKRPEKWRGVWVNPLGKGPRKMVVLRPEGVSKRYPERVELEVTLPRALVETYGEIGARQMVARRVEELCEEARAEARERGWRLPAADEAELLDPMDAPRTPPKKGFTIPTWSAGSDIDAAKRARAARRAFIEAYRAAWLVWSTREDERTVVEFPHGTYLMRVVHACATAPPS